MKKNKTLKPFNAWVIKHKKTNHPVVGGIYYINTEAIDDFNTMPSYDNDGCGKRDDYEIVKVIVKIVGDKK